MTYPGPTVKVVEFTLLRMDGTVEPLLRLVLLPSGALDVVERAAGARQLLDELVERQGVVDATGRRLLRLRDGEAFLDAVWTSARGPFFRASEPFRMALEAALDPS